MAVLFCAFIVELLQNMSEGQGARGLTEAEEFKRLKYAV